MVPRTKHTLLIAAAVTIAGAAAFAEPVADGGKKYIEKLTGQAEIDAGALQADMDGQGTAHVTVNIGQNRVCWNLTDLANLDPITASHIHNAPSTAAGPIKISFFHFGQPIDLEGCTEGSAQFPISRELLIDVVKNPQNYYVNIHTTAYPPGAIRGQLSNNRNT